VSHFTTTDAHTSNGSPHADDRRAYPRARRVGTDPKVSFTTKILAYLITMIATRFPRDRVVPGRSGR
jgi:hypothetical protein